MRLPGGVVFLLMDNSTPVAGVNIGGGLSWISCDLCIKKPMNKQNRKTIIGLGTFARKSDAVQDGTVGMQ